VRRLLLQTGDGLRCRDETLLIECGASSPPNSPRHSFGNQAATRMCIRRGPWLCAPALRPVCLYRERRGPAGLLRRRMRIETAMRHAIHSPATLYHGPKAVFPSGNLSITLSSLKPYVSFAACQIADFNFFQGFLAGEDLSGNAPTENRLSNGRPAKSSIVDSEMERC
jgi:hypothetical protein